MPYLVFYVQRDDSHIGNLCFHLYSTQSDNPYSSHVTSVQYSTKIVLMAPEAYRAINFLNRPSSGLSRGSGTGVKVFFTAVIGSRE